MIENLMYFVITVQIYFLTNHILHIAVTVQSFVKYLWLFSIGIAAFFWLILYAMKPGKFAALIFSFVFGFALFGVNYRYDFLIFISLYLYLLGKLEKKNLLTKKLAILLSPLVLFGLVPFHIKGIFESLIQHKIHSVLYSTALNTSSNGKVSVNRYVISGSGITTMHRIHVLSNTLFKNSIAFQGIIISLASIFLLAILLLFLAKFYLVSKNKRAFSTIMFLGISILTGVIAIITFLFFNIVKLYNFTATTVNHVAASGSKVSPNSYPDIRVIVNRIVGSLQFSNQAGSIFRSAGFMTAILGIILGFAIVYAILNILFINNKEGTLFSKKESKEFTNKIKKKGIERSLAEFTDPEEYIKFLYFSALYLLKEKGYYIEKFETPNEFLNKLSRLLEKPIENFDKLTLTFNKIKYGKPGSLNDIEEFKEAIKPDILLNNIRSLPKRKDNLHSANSNLNVD